MKATTQTARLQHTLLAEVMAVADDTTAKQIPLHVRSGILLFVQCEASRLFGYQQAARANPHDLHAYGQRDRRREAFAGWQASTPADLVAAASAPAVVSAALAVAAEVEILCALASRSRYSHSCGYDLKISF